MSGTDHPTAADVELRAALGDKTTAPARESMLREQDLAARLFRVRERLRLAESDAEAFHSRSLELDLRVQALEKSLAAASNDVRESQERQSSALKEISEQRQYFVNEMQSLRSKLLDSEARRADDARVLAAMRKVAQANARELTAVLTSRTWVMMRPLRRMLHVLRGIPFSEPRPVDLDATSRSGGAHEVDQ
jgi:DNA anti-recombination protein RmuC